MPTLPPNDLATLRTELQDARYAGLTDQERFDLFHGPIMQANPTPQPTIAKPFAFADVMGCLSSTSIANIRDLPTGTDLIDKINAMDRLGVGHWIIALQAGTPLITQAEAAAVMAVLQATELDPSWPSQVLGPSRKIALFGAKEWTDADEVRFDYVPLADFAQ